MRICFDLDNSICTGSPHRKATPAPGMKELIAGLRKRGHTVIIVSARGTSSSPDIAGKVDLTYKCLTESQLKKWGIGYDELHFGKPIADVYVDSKSITPASCEHIESEIDSLSQYEIDSRDKFNSYVNLVQDIGDRCDAFVLQAIGLQDG